MTPLAELFQQGATHAWLFIPSAILLGALHGLEPGHSKTMMAAFIVAIRGTVAQAILLGASATVSHTAIVWLVALGGQYLGRGLNAETSEPYFQLASAVIIVGVAVWMLGRTWRAQTPRHGHGHHHHDDDHAHGHHGHHHHSDTEDGDAHERAHAAALARQLTGQPVTTGQIVLFGLTGGLIPCPAAITVLLLCLQLKQISLGIVLVLSFSIGLALTLVAVGIAAALSVRHAAVRWPGFDRLARRLPYASGALILLVGLYMGVHGVLGIRALGSAT
jgi:nickel/cobalt transporter (NicO) family protein